MNIKNFVYFVSILGLIGGSSAGEIAEKIIDAKKKIGELEVQQTTIALQIAREGQNLKQIENNAMLDTQNFISSEKDKTSQLKTALEKIDELAKKQSDLIIQVEKLRAEISETKKQQKKALAEEIKNSSDEPIAGEENKDKTDKRSSKKISDTEGKIEIDGSDAIKPSKKASKNVSEKDMSSTELREGDLVKDDETKNSDKDGSKKNTEMTDDASDADTSAKNTETDKDNDANESSEDNELEANKAIEDAEKATEESAVNDETSEETPEKASEAESAEISENSNEE